MKRIFLLMLLIALGGLAAAQSPVVTMINETGNTVEYLYASSNQSDKWEDDVLGRNVLLNGKSFKMTLPENGTYDFRMVDKEDNSYYKWNVIVRGDMTLTMTPEDFEEDDDRPEAERPVVFTGTPRASSTWMTVVNNTNADIYYLYISLSDADGWYGDVLKKEILEKGKEIQVRLPRSGTWDLKAVHENDTEFYKIELSISQGNNRIVIQPSDRD